MISGISDGPGLPMAALGRKIAPERPLIRWMSDEAKVNEDEVKVLGDTSELLPNKSASVEVTLSPGSYLLICNVPGHYAAGMAVPLIVKP